MSMELMTNAVPAGMTTNTPPTDLTNVITTNTSLPGGQMNSLSVEICFRLSVIENMLHNVIEAFSKISSSDLHDNKTIENLRQVVECLLQARGSINHKHGHTRWLLDGSGRQQQQVGAKFESRMSVHHGIIGDDGGGGGTTTTDFLYIVDVSDALDHNVDENLILDYGLKPSAAATVKEQPPHLVDSKDEVLQSVWYKKGLANGLKMAATMEEDIKVECNVEVEPDSSWYEDWMLDQHPLFKEDADFDDENYPPPPLVSANPRHNKRRSRINGEEGSDNCYKCDKCDATFAKEEYLRQHETLFVHDKYRCEVCGQTFSWKKTFDQHIANDHRDDNDEKKPPPTASSSPFSLKQEDTTTTTLGASPMVDSKEAVTRLDGDGASAIAADGGVKTEFTDSVATGITEAVTHETVDAHHHLQFGEGATKLDVDALPDNQDDVKYNGHETEAASTEVPKKECDICGKLVKESSFAIHRKIHSGEKPYSCNVCGKAFLRRNNMRNHRLKHGPRQRIKCADCGKGFLNQVSLDKHLLRGGCEPKHGGGPADSLEFALQELDPEEATAAKKNKKKYPYKQTRIECEICGKMMHRTNLYKHRRTHTGEKPYSCTVCEKSFITHSNLKLHMVSHGPREKILCQICGKGFLNQSSIKKHVCGKSKVPRGKNKDKPATISCKICGKLVKYEGSLRSHMKVHSEERPYTCEVCGESFRRPYEINIHKMRCHEQPKCDMCGSSFNSISALNKHQQVVHSDDRPYSCDVCGKAYKEKQTLIKHKVIHNKDEHVKCEVCTKSFFFLNDLKKHYQKVHKLEITVK